MRKMCIESEFCSLSSFLLTGLVTHRINVTFTTAKQRKKDGALAVHSSSSRSMKPSQSWKACGMLWTCALHPGAGVRCLDAHYAASKFIQKRPTQSCK